ncbi:zinc knuckle CX2CX4HX4C containing protein, partial [Tanacetum coccineum]
HCRTFVLLNELQLLFIDAGFRDKSMEEELEAAKKKLSISRNGGGGGGWDDGGQWLDGGCRRLGWWPPADEVVVVAAEMRQAPGMVKPEIGGNVNFEIKSQFMRELREETFSGNKDEDAYDHVDRFLNIGPIPGMTPTQALTAIQTMAGHSQKWHNRTLSRSLSSSSNTDGLAAIVNKLDNLGRDMKKLKENVHAIQIGYQICEGPHLDKECPLNEEVKKVEEAKYGEFGRPAPFNGSNGVKYHVGPPGYYTRTDNRPPYVEKRPSLEELMNKHLEESTWRMPHGPISSSKLNNLHKVSDFQKAQNKTTRVLQYKLPPKELNPGNFTLPCTIGNFNFYGMADLGASVNVMPRNIFEYLKLANLRKTNMLIEMADMTKKAPLGIIENVLVKISKFLFPSYFVIIDKTPNETIILGVDNNGVNYDMEKKDHFTTPTEKIFMIKSGLEKKPQSPTCSNNQSRDLRNKLPNDSLCDQEIDQLADEYELRIGKKGHMLDKIWEYCKNVHKDNMCWWHDHGFEEEECDEMGIEIEKYYPPKVQVETFDVKRYSFKGGQSFVCVTKEVDDALPLGRKNGLRFREMIRKEFDIDAHDKM